MLAIIVLGTAVGAILGSRFKIFILGPAFLLASSATVLAGLIGKVDAHTIVLALLAILAAVQFGYVVGGVAAASLSVQTKPPNRTWTPSRYY